MEHDLFENGKPSQLVRLAVLVSGLLVAWVAVPAAAIPRSGASERAVQEMLIRLAISTQPKVTAWFIDDGGEKDPPADFLKRFADLKVSVRGVSEAKIEGGVVSDPETGKEGWIITTRIARWIDDTTAEVEYKAYHAGMAARGQKGVARLKEGKWVFEATEMWIS